MAAQKPPNPVGERTAFPWQTRWENFAPECESLCEVDNDYAVNTYEALRRVLENSNIAVAEFSRDDVAEVIEEAKAKPKDAAGLADRLYRVGAAYLIPKLQVALKLTPSDTKAQAEKIARLADELTETLKGTDLDAMWSYFIDQQFTRLLEPDADEPPPELSAFPNLLRDLEDLADGARVLADEVPILRPGTSVAVLTRRLIRDAAIQMRDADLGPFTFASSGGHEPVSDGARTLLQYLNLLLNATFSRQTIYNVLKENGLHTGRPPGRPTKPKLPR